MEKGDVRKDFFQVILLLLKEQNELTGRKEREFQAEDTAQARA